MGIALLAVLSLAVIGSVVACDDQPENIVSVHEAIEAGDYDAWYETMSEKYPAMTDKINEENFATFVELYNAAVAGDYETAKALSEELGLDEDVGPGSLQTIGANKEATQAATQTATRATVEEAIEAGDYATWYAIMSEKNPGMAEQISEEDFPTFSELFKAKNAGDYQTAKELKEELDFEAGPNGQEGFGRPF